MFWLLLMLQTKHLILDFLWQPPYEYLNKGKYGHPGGLIHAGKSGFGTFLCFYIYNHSILYSFLVGIVEAAIHYNIDYIKIQLNRLYDLKPNNENFFRLIGVDQFLHQTVYLVLAFSYAN